jgi:hypothetical protein
MTPLQFATAYFPTATRVSAGTGIDSTVLLAQWANETAWGTVVVSNNLGNIRCSPTTFCRYATLDDFATACVATFHNGFYEPVLRAGTPSAQLAAIVASPWSSGHYGGSLQSFYLPLEEAMNINEKRAWVLISFVAALGRTPASAADRDGWANQITDDGSNLDAIVTNIVNSPEGMTHLAAIRALVAAGPAKPGPAGPPGPQGQAGPPGPAGTTPTTGTIAGPITVKLT